MYIIQFTLHKYENTNYMHFQIMALKSIPMKEKINLNGEI